MKNLSVIVPARNESDGLRLLLPQLLEILPNAEIVVVNDGSDDDTRAVCAGFPVVVINNPYCKGNGAAVKSGVRAARGEVLLFMDADGQHQPKDIPALLEKLEQGYDMVVGARGKGSQAGIHRAFANGFYNRLASWMVGQRIDDLTSGFRVARANKFRKYLYMLPNGFSYPTTITMCFFRAGLSVGYVPIHAPKRVGNSHMRIMRDGVRFLLIIFKIGTLYSPLKLFFPISVSFFTMGCGYYIYTFVTQNRFTNMSTVLFITSILVFLMGLISEQITQLVYKDQDRP
ncbi:MAG: glycosyltransferase family 2 protein [Gallionella sp.]